jgi:hypothetical protein
LWRKLVPNLEDDNLQGFPNEKISKSKIPDIVCTMISSENANKDNEEWLQSDARELGFQHERHGHCSCCCKIKGRRTGWKG